MRTDPLSPKALAMVRKVRGEGITIEFVATNAKHHVARWTEKSGATTTLLADGSTETLAKPVSAPRVIVHKPAIEHEDADGLPDPWANAPLTALVAREMASHYPEEDWDAWKDEMKEAEARG